MSTTATIGEDADAPGAPGAGWIDAARGGARPRRAHRVSDRFWIVVLFAASATLMVRRCGPGAAVRASQ